MHAAKLLTAMFRVSLKIAYALLKARWFVTRPRTFGSHAVAMTPSGRIILVKLRYASGWRLPGGRRREMESAEQALVRELREEIGLISFGEVRRVCDFDETFDFKRDLASLFVVRDVRYQTPRWSWEIEDVLEADLDDLPKDLSPGMESWIQSVLPGL